MAKLMRCHVDRWVPRSVPNINQIGSSHEPQDIRCSSPIQQGVHSMFQPTDGSPLNWILLLIVWFRKFIFNQELAMNVLNFFTFFFCSIVTTECTGSSLFADEIPVIFRELVFPLESFNVNVFGLKAIEKIEVRLI